MTRRLHIGALNATPGWETLNTLPLPGIDHICDAADLSRFPDNSFDTLYASHVLEHFDYRDQVLAVLKEWQRVLTPGGQLLISVPEVKSNFCCKFDPVNRFPSPVERNHLAVISR